MQEYFYRSFVRRVWLVGTEKCFTIVASVLASLDPEVVSVSWAQITPTAASEPLEAVAYIAATSTRCVLFADL